MESNKELQEFGHIIDQLHKLSDELISVINSQIEAVVASDDKQVEKYVEQYTKLRGTFKDQEHKFMDHLQMLLNSSEITGMEIKLESLKEVYPEKSETIARWQQSLDDQINKLKKKHQKLNELLEFAVEKNMKLMHSIYSLHNKKSTRYSSGGTKEEISSGIAVNKEA